MARAGREADGGDDQLIVYFRPVEEGRRLCEHVKEES